MHRRYFAQLGQLAIVLFLSYGLHAQQKSFLVVYDGYHYAAGNEYKAIDTRTTLKISGSFSYSYDSSLPIKRPLGDTQNVYGKMTKARQVMKNRSENQLVVIGRNHLLEKTNYPIADTLFGFEWVFTSQTKTIESLPCKKAICIWRGRAYSAWYTEEIPIPEGPWKFGGLPGLIVEIYDEERNFYWKMVSFKNVPYEAIEVPTAQKSYHEVVTAFRKEAHKRLAAARAQLIEVDPSCKSCNEAAIIQYPTIENWSD